MIQQYGWNPSRQFLADQQFGEGAIMARVLSESRTQYEIICTDGMHPAQTTGAMQHHAASRLDMPTVGDWVHLRALPAIGEMALIDAVMERQSLFMRKQAGPTEQPQPIAANIDTLFVVTGLDFDLNPARIERYVAQAWQSGAEPVLVLTKSDLKSDWQRVLDQMQRRMLSVDCIAISSVTGSGFDELDRHLQPGRTIALVGSSGAGKSTLLNALAGHELASTQQVRADDSRGRHTTTSRNLYLLPSGTMVLDTPGMRELGLWGVEGNEAGFEYIAELGKLCRFADCQHQTEPDCAVLKAVDAGTLEQSRLNSYHRLMREAAHQLQKQTISADYAERLKWKAIHKAARHLPKP